MALTADEWNERNRSVIEEFRARQGDMGERQLLLLTTRGRRSGELRTNPLIYRQEGDRVFVIASKQGSPEHPDWYLNLVADPNVTVELGPDRFEATATPLEGAERADAYARQAAQFPFFADYEQQTSREIPVVLLERRA